MIQTDLGTVLQASAVLHQFVAQHNLSAKLAFKLARAMKAMTHESELFGEQRLKEIEKLGGKPNPAANKYEFPNGDEDEKKLEAALKEIQAVTVTLNCDRINLDELNGVEFKPFEMEPLVDWLIVDNASPTA